MELFVPFFPSAFVLEYHKEAEEIIEGGGYTGLGESKMSGLYGRVTLKFNSLTLACCTGESQPEYKKRDVINNKRVNGSRRTFRENKLLLFFFFFFRFFSLPSLAKDFSFFFSLLLLPLFMCVWCPGNAEAAPGGAAYSSNPVGMEKGIRRFCHHEEPIHFCTMPLCSTCPRWLTQRVIHV